MIDQYTTDLGQNRQSESLPIEKVIVLPHKFNQEKNDIMKQNIYYFCLLVMLVTYSCATKKETTNFTVHKYTH
jgi:hypothetical protein